MGLFKNFKEQALKNASLDKLKEQAMNRVNSLSKNIMEKMNEMEKSQAEEDEISSYQSELAPDEYPNYEASRQQHQDTRPIPPSILDQPVVEQMPPMPVPQVPANNNSSEGCGIYGDYLEHLIEMALADGELTEKEKQILFKKAEANGIDLDEFEMVLDARLYEKQKTMRSHTPAAHDSAPKSDKYGDVRKCPSCGAVVESFSTRCPDCGHEFSNIESIASITRLFEKLEKLESQKTGRFKDTFKDEAIDDRIAKIIQTFPVPTTKEDILEFLSMAVPLASDDCSEFFGDWKNKCEQVIIKARFSMKEDPELLEQIENYADKLGLNKEKKGGLGGFFGKWL